jgi:hypothetical protein
VRDRAASTRIIRIARPAIEKKWERSFADHPAPRESLRYASWTSAVVESVRSAGAPWSWRCAMARSSA